MATARKTKTSKPISGEEWVTLGDAGRALGITRQTVLTRIVKGDLVAQYVAGQTFVMRASLDALLVRQS